MSSGLILFRRGVHVSLLEEKSHSHGTADACAGRISIARRKRYGNLAPVRADLKSNHLVTKRCPLLPWDSGVAAGVLVGPN